MTRHARCSPSSSSIWFYCPGSVKLGEKVKEFVEEESSEAADEGSRIHEEAAKRLVEFIGKENCTVGAGAD